MELAKKTGRVWISPYDDDHVQAGNGGTTALEIFEDMTKKPDAIVVPVGRRRPGDRARRRRP
jgi:threonine dehydratase